MHVCSSKQGVGFPARTTYVAPWKLGSLLYIMLPDLSSPNLPSSHSTLQTSHSLPHRSDTSLTMLLWPINLPALQCSSPPPTLWRIQHANSRARFYSNGDLGAEGYTYTPPSESFFTDAVRDQLSWGRSRVSSSFLSAFGDREHAIRWGRWKAWELGDAQLVEFDTLLVQDTPVFDRMIFKLDDLLAALGIETDLDTSDEYLILHVIPRVAIRDRLAIGDVLNEGQ
jgi:hypothetical protein